MYDDKNIDYKVLGIQKSSVILFSMGKTIVSSNKSLKNEKISTRSFLFLICCRYKYNLNYSFKNLYELIIVL